MNPSRRRRVAMLPNALAFVLLGGCGNSSDVPVNGQDTQSIRTFIGKQAGGLNNLMVPAADEAIPVPTDDAMRPGRYKTTRAKTFLGKMLFHDPIRTAHINLNQIGRGHRASEFARKRRTLGCFGADE